MKFVAIVVTVVSVGDVSRRHFRQFLFAATEEGCAAATFAAKHAPAAAAVRKMAAAMAAGNSELNRQVANNAKKNETRRNPNIRTNERNKSIRIWFEMDRKC